MTAPLRRMDSSNILTVVLFLIIAGSKTDVEAKLTIYREPEGPLFVTEGEDALLTLNITGIERNVVLAARSAHPGTFVVQDNATFYLKIGEEPLDFKGNGTQDFDMVSNITIRIWVTGKFVGISELILTSRNTETQQQTDMEITPHIVKVKRQPSALVEAFSYVLVVWLILSYVSMGSTMNWESIWSKLRQPYGVVIGLLCQFILMPALSFTLAKLLRLENEAALGLVIIGCCPGGWVSNIYSLLLDCDLTLSITMTMCSTVIALGAMPANLYIYGSHFATEAIPIPYGTASAQIIMLVIPVFFGMILYYKVPKLAALLGKFLRIIAMIMILIGAGFGIPSNLYAFYAPLEILFVALLLPIVGSILGFLIAKATCLHNISAVTVALETGAQNSLLGTVIAQFAFPQPEADLISRIPLMVAMFTMGYGTLVTLIYVIMNKYPGKIHVPEKDKNACKECGMIVPSVKSASQAENGSCPQPETEVGVANHQKTSAEGRVNSGFDKVAENTEVPINGNAKKNLESASTDF